MDQDLFTLVKSVTRTGCTACLSAGVACDPSNPQCQRGISDKWRVNEPFADLCQFGAWNDRRAMHYFIQEFTHTPQLAGLFKSDFWHESVPRALLHSQALFLLGSAIGMLHEDRTKSHNLQQPVGRSPAQTRALELCNESIRLMVAQSGDVSDAETSLIGCVLFAHFENEQLNGRNALLHIAQSPKLLRNLIESHSAGHAAGLVDVDNARRLVKGLTMQASCITNKDIPIDSTILEDWGADLPQFSYFDSVDEAHFALHTAYLSILATGNRCAGQMSLSELQLNVNRRRHAYLPWLLHWEHCFYALVSKHEPSWAEHEQRAADILRANYQIMTIFTKLDETLSSPWSPFLYEFRSVADFCNSALSRGAIDLPTISSDGCFPLFSNELSVVQPLFYTMSRCTEHATRVRAGQMLLSLRSSVSSQQDQAASPEERADLDRWTLEDWLQFSAKTSLHTSPAAFFGGMLASEAPSSIVA